MNETRSRAIDGEAAAALIEPLTDLVVRAGAAILAVHRRAKYIPARKDRLQQRFGLDHQQRPAPRDAAPPAPKWPVAEKPTPYPLVGTDRDHILRIDPSGDNVIAVYCNWG